MFFTEFCWEFWSFILFSYMLLLDALQTSNLTIIILGALSALMLSAVLIFAINRAYAQTYRNGPYQDMIEFYQRRRFKAVRSILFLMAYVLVYLIIL